MSQKPKFYVVWKGRNTGIFSSWEECAVQVQGFPGAQYKSFASRLAAEKALRGKYAAHVGKPVFSGEWLFSPNAPMAGSWCVDASCSGSPGRLEFRGVDLRTGREVFRQGPYEHGTNNVGEFLAIVQALMMLKTRRSTRAIYSDSTTAIGWVKKKSCNTELAADEKNAMLFALINSAEEWLTGHTIANPILKWDTEAWGEIPADFNRK
ncbi:MAG: ribonuclease H family protein [Anaerolineales bacterium]|jgi:ribonuclease HI